MPVKERLSGVSIHTLVPVKPKPVRLTIQEEILSSKPFVIPKRNFKHASFTGRQRELDYLTSFYRETLTRLKKQNSGGEETFKPYIIGIKGEAGIGKSRLVREFHVRTSSAVSNCRFISGGSYSSGQNPYGLISGLLKNSFNLPAENNIYDNVLPVIKQACPDLSGENISHLAKTVCGKVSYGNSIAVKNAAKEYLFFLCNELNKENIPLVLILEDMQWADEPSLEVLEHIVRSVNLYTDKKQPQMLFVMNYRAGFKPSKSLRTESEYKELTLEALTEKETNELITSLSGGKAAGDKARGIILKRSDGNPFNIEEWCRLLLDDKTTRAVPATVKSLLAERVSELEPGERAVLIAASVLGRKFELRIVNEILKNAEKHEPTEKIMQNLVDKKYIVNLTGDVYEFRHDLLQEIIYRYLNINTRRNAHLLAGTAIESLYSNELHNYYYELARHYTEAKDEQKSPEYLEKAGDKAKDNYEHERAIRYYGKLLNVVTCEKRYNITFKLCDVYMNRSEWNKQIELCNNILAESLRLDKNIKAECYKRTGHAYRLKGDYKDALKVYKKAYRIYEEKHEVQGKLDIMEHEAKVMMNMGKYKESLASFEMIYKISKEKRYDELYKNSLIGLGIVNSKFGKYSETIKYSEELHEHSLTNKNTDGIITSEINKAEAVYFMGNYDLATEIYLKALRKAKILSKQQEIPICLGNLGVIYQTKKKFKKALNYFQQQLHFFINCGDKPGISRALGLIGSCYISLCNFNKALYFLYEQLQMCTHLKRKQTEAVCVGNIAVVYSQLGDYSKANKYFKKQLLIDTGLSNYEGIFRALLNMGILYRNSGNYFKSNKFISKALYISNNAKIRYNLELAYSYYSESLYWLKKYWESSQYAQKALIEATNNNNIIIRLHSLCFLQKSKLMLLIKKNTDTYIEFTKLHMHDIKNYMSNNKSIEIKALLNYEMIQIYLIIKKAKRKNPVNNIYEYLHKGLRQYQNLYKKTLIFEYKNRYIELKHIYEKELQNAIH